MTQLLQVVGLEERVQMDSVGLARELAPQMNVAHLPDSAGPQKIIAQRQTVSLPTDQLVMPTKSLLEPTHRRFREPSLDPSFMGPMEFMIALILVTWH